MPVPAGPPQLDTNLDLQHTPDRDVWAHNLYQEFAKKPNKNLPRAEDLEQAITQIHISDQMKGSGTITITLYDPMWELVDSGIFDANADGKLDDIVVQYPEDGRLWWCITQLSIDESHRGGATITLTFMEWTAIMMMKRLGPLKVNRTGHTRAEFIMMMFKSLAARGVDTRPTFISKQLHKDQPVGSGKELKQEKKQKQEARDQANKSPNDKRRDKDKGISGSVQMKGVQANSGQVRQAERALTVADKLNAGEKATLAMLCAGIGESDFTPVVNSLGYGGVFQGQVNTGGHYFKVDDTEEEAYYFLKGGKGFQQGGAIHLAKTNMNVGEIATRVEASGEAGHFYGQYLSEARAILKAWGGAGASGGSDDTGTVFSRKDYYFKCGKRETYWDCANRLADEVNWALTLDGFRVYYDSETTLIQQKPIKVIGRADDYVIGFTSTWDRRHICTEATLVLLCEPFEFRAGEVFVLEDFGMASSGSTVKLPGRWLIDKVERDRWDLTSTFTLKQPSRPKAEPLGELVQQTGAEAAGSAAARMSGPVRERIVKNAEASMTSKTGFRRYSQGGRMTDDPTPPSGCRTDCSQWARAIYLQSGAKDPGGYTGAMIQKSRRTGKPKPGDLILGPSHVEIYVGGGKTIGHGSPPIDHGDVAYWRQRGMWFATYDFLD